MTIQYRIPIRRNVPQAIGPYTFKDQNGNIIPLTNYITFNCEVKVQGALYQILAAQLTGLPATGQVQTINPFAFPSVGTWDVQFVCIDGSGNNLYGEPIQINVVPNVDDLALTQLPVY